MTARSQKRPQDVTGRLAEELAATHAEELAEKSRTTALVTSQRAEDQSNKVVDYSKEKPVVEVAKTVEVRDAFTTIRTNCDLEQVTIGKGTSFDFEMGMRYRVPVHVADHLEEKGLLWH